MVWCNERKIIFIHIPKTGGTSIERYLDLVRYYKGYGTIKEICLQHLLGIDYKVLLTKDFDEYFKFTIVRNPIDRMISEYYWNEIDDGYVNDKSFDQFLDTVEEKLQK